MEILYQGKRYNAYPSDHFAVEEAVCVNGVTGWIDYTGFDKIVIVDENNFRHHIKYADIESVYILYRNSIVDFNGKHKRIMPYNWRGAKNKLQKEEKRIVENLQPRNENSTYNITTK